MGPNQAMNARWGLGRSVPASETPTAAGLATNSAQAMNAISAGIAKSYPVATMIAPKTKKVRTWKIAVSYTHLTLPTKA